MTKSFRAEIISKERNKNNVNNYLLYNIGITLQKIA